MEYSICIRTLGRGGEKYEALLNSIKELDPKPKEVIVVIPEGYSLPKERLGFEKFVIGKKGMLLQRIQGYEAATSEYVLLLDDDLEFDCNVVKQLYSSIEKNNAQISFPVYEKLLPQKRYNRLNSMFTLSTMPRHYTKKYIGIMPSGGYTYPKDINLCDEELESESGPGMCIFAKRDVLLDIDLRNELWVEIPSYALREDAVLIYKAYLMGYKVIARKNINIEHLDNAKDDNTREVKIAYAIGFSQINFWYRFIFSNQKKFINKTINIICLTYWIMCMNLMYFLKGCRVIKFDSLNAFVNGVKDGFSNVNHN